MEIKEIVRALRCSASPGGNCIKEKCPYFVRATKEEIDEFIKKNGVGADWPMNMWESCDCDKIALDAADALENIKKERFTWHDLEKNPDDLPEEFEDVFVEFEYFRYGDYNRIVKNFGISYQIEGRFNTVNGSTGWKDLKILKWMRTH